MGSFFVQCAASRQVIKDHDAVAVLVLQQQSSLSPQQLSYTDRSGLVQRLQHHPSYERCGISAHWAPCGSFLTGRYADMGTFTLDDTPSNRIGLYALLNPLLGRPVAAESDKNPRFDLRAKAQEIFPDLVPTDWMHGLRVLPLYSSAPWKVLAELWEYLQAGIQQQRAFAQDSGTRTPQGLELTVFRFDAFSALIALGEQQAGGRSQVLQQLLSEYRDLYQDDAAEGGTGALFIHAANLCDRWMAHCDEATVVVRHHLRARRQIADLAAELLADAGDNPALQLSLLDQARTALDYGYAIKGLSAMNLPLTPLIYSGQDYDNIQGQRYADFLFTVTRNSQ